MTATAEPTEGVPPMPDAARFRPIERPQRGRQTYTTVPTWTRPTSDDLDALPVGTRRTAAFVPGVFVTLLKTDEGWTLLARHRIPGDVLAGLRSAPRVPIDPEDGR